MTGHVCKHANLAIYCRECLRENAAEPDEFDADAEGFALPACGPAERAILDDAETSARVLLELDGPAPVRAAPAPTPATMLWEQGARAGGTQGDSGAPSYRAPAPAPAPPGSPEDAAAWARWHERSLERAGMTEAAPAPTPAAAAAAVCPRCLAAQYLPVMRTIVALPPSPDTNHAAHAAGFGIGALRLIAERPHAPCARHRGGG